MPYVFELNWRAGKLHLIADAFSRAPVSPPEPLDDAALRQVASLDSSLEPTIRAAAERNDYMQILTAVKDRKDPNDLPPDHPAKGLNSIWQYLSTSTDDRLIIYDSSKIFVPIHARKQVIDFLHRPHCGFVKTKNLAQELYFWPQMTAEIKTKINECRSCTRLSPSQSAETLVHSKADFPMDFLGVDLFYSEGSNYLCAVDRFSGFPFVQKLRSLNTRSVTKQLLTWFSDFGMPRTIRTDGGPQFRSEFQEFCRTNGIRKELTSPYNPQANGLAESAVKQMKYLIQKVGKDDFKFRQALLSWRNTPRADGVSPAQMMFGFRQNFGQGNTANFFLNRDAAKDSRLDADAKAKKKFDSRARDLPRLEKGERVVTQDPKTKRWDTFGRIDSARDDNRSYIINCDDGPAILRNRRFIKVAQG